jgi:hypothetical protein
MVPGGDFNERFNLRALRFDKVIAILDMKVFEL